MQRHSATQGIRAGIRRRPRPPVTRGGDLNTQRDASRALSLRPVDAQAALRLQRAFDGTHPCIRCANPLCSQQIWDANGFVRTDSDSHGGVPKAESSPRWDGPQLRLETVSPIRRNVLCIKRRLCRFRKPPAPHPGYVKNRRSRSDDGGQARRRNTVSVPSPFRHEPVG